MQRPRPFKSSEQGPAQTTTILLRGGAPISLFLLFLVFFPHSNHHYLDKLLTLPEKLNYINNSTMKILSPSEKCTAANKNLPDFHQATWVWAIVMCDRVVLPEVLSSVLSFIYVYICFSLRNILIYVCLTMKPGVSFLFPTPPLLFFSFTDTLRLKSQKSHQYRKVL